ncbi:MAG: DedA family protein [Bdellovibrionota bacterium]
MDNIVEFLLYMQGPVPYIAAFTVLLLCGLGLPIPEDITLFAMGLLSYYGLVDFKLSIVVCMVGVLFGDSVIYFIGRKYGLKLTQRGIFAKVLPPDRMERVREMFLKWGNKVIFAARFMPGLRAPTYFSAGTLHLPFRIFFFYDGLASILSVPLLVGVVYYFGDHVDRVIQVARQVQNGIVFLILAIIAVFVIKHKIAKRKKP